ncbi:MAG: hypothetical protein JKY92_09290 [Magnetovibrio sp.]|nr:hypothetical protein [Magnetovibrio sp.]
MFATASGNVRRNRMSDFTNVMVNGKIAMKLSEDDKLVGVAACSEDDDVLLSARGGKCIRFPVLDVRVFQSRASTGVRGMKFKDMADEVISMTIVGHVDSVVGERKIFLKIQSAKRRAEGVDGGEDSVTDPTQLGMSLERFEELEAKDQFILTVTENGFGKRTSAYDYRIAGRGGLGITSIVTSERNGSVVASFPVIQSDELVMVTDGGQLIRTRVHDIRIAARNTQGVTLFKTSKGEHVVSVTRLSEVEDDGDDMEDGDEVTVQNESSEATEQASEAEKTESQHEED